MRVYHHTDARSAARIYREQRLVSAGEPRVYVTTVDYDTGYGDTVVPIELDERLLELDDEFPDGRRDYSIEVGRGRDVRVKAGKPFKSRRSNPPLFPGDPEWHPDWVIAVDDESDPDVVVIRVLQEGREIGRLGIAPSEIVPGAWGVHDASVGPGYEGRGLGQALYLIAMRLYGKLHPDWEQAVSHSAMRTWKAMKRRGLITGTRFHGFDDVRVSPNEEFDDDDHVNVESHRYYIAGVFPKGWEGTLDQVYRLKDASSVPLVEIRRG